MIRWLRSFIFNIAFYGLTVLMGFLLLWTLPLSRPIMLRVVHLWLGSIAWIERNIAGIHMRARGVDHIPVGPCIVAVKHQSAWETLKLHEFFHDPAIVLKKELLRVPVWGWYLRRAGMIPIDRARRGGALPGMMIAARKAKNEGRKIVIFPQGTRIAPGEYRPYKPGIASLYQELQLPVVPMAVNAGLFWPKSSFIKHPGTVTVEFLPPIPPGLNRTVFLDRLETELETASNRLCDEEAARTANPPA